MSDLDPKIIELLDKLGVVTQATTAALGANQTAIKSVTANMLAEKKAYSDLVKSIKDLTNANDTEADQIAKQIKLEEKEYDLLQKRLEKEKEQDEQRKKAVQQAVKDLMGFAKQSVSATQSVYNSNDAFTAVIPTLQLVGTAFKAITTAIAGAAAGVPFLGGISEGAAKVVGAAVDIAQAVVEAQLQNAQKYVNTYASLSKVGVTFGGAVEKMRESAAEGGMNLDAYNKFIVSNIQNLSLLGGSTEEGAARVSKMGKVIADNNPKLLSMYGSYEDLQGATSDYMAMMSRYGININKTDKDLTSGAKEYLFNMKELSALTGKSADELKKAEEERSKSAAYDLALSRMGVEEAQNSRNAIELTGKNYGDVAAKYAQEFIATNGHVTSEAALQFKAMYPEISKTVDMTLGVTKQTTAEFAKSSADIIQGRLEQNKKEVEGYEHLYKLQAGGVQAPMLEMANNVGAAFLKNITAAGDMVKTVNDLQNARKTDATAATIANSDAIKGMNRFKMTIDEQTEKALPEIGKMVDALLKVQGKLNEMGQKFVSAIDSVVIPSLQTLADALDELTGGGKRKPGFKNTPPVRGTEGTAPPVVTPNGAALAVAPHGVRRRPLPAAADSRSSGGAAGSSEKTGDIADIIDFGNNTGDRAHFDQLDADVKSQFIEMADAYFVATNGKKLKINSAFRSPEEQAALKKSGGNGANPIAEPGKSLHNKGRAIDINSAQVTQLSAMKMLQDFGFKPLSGDAPHIQMLAKGGVTNGPSVAGEAGPEAVVPLPDGRNIPVRMDNSELIDKLDELLTVMKDHRDTSEKILWSNN